MIMSSLTNIETLKLESIFDMSGGYVMTFSNQTLSSFIFKCVGKNIYNDKYAYIGDSKAKRLRAFWDLEDDKTVGKLTEEMLLLLEAQRKINNTYESLNITVFGDCMNIAYRLQGKRQKHVHTTEVTEDEFLNSEIDEISIGKIKIDSSVAAILDLRIQEISKCLKAGASLSVIFLCGSVLEGVLLGVATKSPSSFNMSPLSPKDKSSGKVKQFHEWSLSNFIDVAHDLKILGLDVKKFGHALRDFRNYIHPYEQMSSGFSPDTHTARISWQVLKAALNDIHENLK